MCEPLLPAEASSPRTCPVALTKRHLSLIIMSVLLTILVLCFFLFYTFTSLYGYVIAPGPLYVPTDGYVWPQPQHEIKKVDFYTFSPERLNVTVSGYSCGILKNAIERYKLAWSKMHSIAEENKKWMTEGKIDGDRFYRGNVIVLEVMLQGQCEQYPHMDMEESYKMTVDKISVLNSSSIWGILRGLESFTHLFYFANNYTEIWINGTEIKDFPVYKHRGLLIDTGRHYLSLENIRKTIDALSMNKMNVLHWHIVDDQSFPFQSKRFPELSQNGAYFPSMIYTKTEIAELINYARDRGVRIIPEIDVPGHTRSWGVSHPSLLTKCFQHNKFSGLGPLNPISNVTFKLLRDLYQEVQELFPDQYFHIGGDEVNLDCWNSNPEIQKYMKDNNLTVKQLHANFMLKVINILGNRTKAMVWQEVFDNSVPISNDTLVQVWNYVWVDEMVKILAANHSLILSATWYLDYLNFAWTDYYLDDPRRMVYKKDPSAKVQNILGGEVCMWGERADDTNVIMKVWPRTSAVAERLWTGLDYKDPPATILTTLVKRRMEEHTCRMRRRGVDAQPPNGPSFCIGVA